jgi:hypothetical protein
LANKALAVVTSAGFISALAMAAVAHKVSVNSNLRNEWDGMVSAPVACTVEYCPNGDLGNLGSRSSFWVLDFGIEWTVTRRREQP